jgi:hypothetical protein
LAKRKKSENDRAIFLECNQNSASEGVEEAEYSHAKIVCRSHFENENTFCRLHKNGANRIIALNDRELRFEKKTFPQGYPRLC